MVLGSHDQKHKFNARSAARTDHESQKSSSTTSSELPTTTGKDPLKGHPEQHPFLYHINNYIADARRGPLTSGRGERPRVRAREQYAHLPTRRMLTSQDALTGKSMNEMLRPVLCHVGVGRACYLTRPVLSVQHWCTTYSHQPLAHPP